MKKIFYLTLALAMCLGFTACDDDNDSNPVFYNGDGTFVLNTPPYALNNVLDLANTSTVNLTCCQPKYYNEDGTLNEDYCLNNILREGGLNKPVPLVTVYTVNVSLDSAYFESLPTTYTTTDIRIPVKEFNNTILSLADMAGIDVESIGTLPVYIYLTSHVQATNTEDLGRSVSNTICLPNVLPYTSSAVVELPETMYMTGDFPAGSGWGNWVQYAPVYDKAGQFYAMVYFQDGAQFKINPENKWGGKEMGYNSGVAIEDPTGAGISSSSDGNFVIGRGGWYTMYVKSEVAKGELKYTMYLCEPNVYIFGNTNGGVWEYNDAWKFAVPADATGDFVSPALTAGGEVRIAVQLPSIDWWRTEFTLKDGQTIYYRNENIANNWNDDLGSAYSIQAQAGQKVYLNFTDGTGSCY